MDKPSNQAAKDALKIIETMKNRKEREKKELPLA